jgi:hypothetical protein
VLSTPALARADGPTVPAPSPVAVAPPPPVATAPAGSSRPARNGGWAIVVLSLAIGSSVTAVSVAHPCSSDNLECARWTSLGIWSGIGIASLGTVAGLLLVKAASPQPPRVTVSVTVDRTQHGPSTPRAALVCVF